MSVPGDDTPVPTVLTPGMLVCLLMAQIALWFILLIGLGVLGEVLGLELASWFTCR